MVKTWPIILNKKKKRKEKEKEKEGKTCEECR